MKIEIVLFCFIIPLRSFEIESKKTFLSCDNFGNFRVTFDCSSLGYKILHKNYLNGVKDATCTADGYFSISKNFSSAFQVTLKNCQLPNTPYNFLQRLRNVQQINLDSSGIKTIDNRTFPDGCSLVKLSMSENDLTKLPGFVFSQMPNISEIHLSHNRINNIDLYTFRGTTKMLKIIDLSHNNIDMIDKPLFEDLINLNQLNLAYNFIEHFQVDLSNLKDLTVLRLDNNKIARLDCTIFDLTTNTIAIRVDYNHIQEIDLNCDVHLESLDLNINDNQLTSLTFPKSYLLNSITKMHASRNHITKITFQHNFRRLTDLHLDTNNLKELVEWEETMFPKLMHLDISNNQFNCSYLSKFLKKLPKKVQLGVMNGDWKGNIDFIRKHEKGSTTSKTIHGISCYDDLMTENTYDDAQITIWCLLAFLSFGAVVRFILYAYKNGYCRQRKQRETNIYLHASEGSEATFHNVSV